MHAGGIVSDKSKYTSIVQAVKGEPALSTLADVLSANPDLAKAVSNPKWTGTLFAPVNSVS